MPSNNESDFGGITLGERVAQRATRWTGSTVALLVAVLTVAAWMVTGPLFHWADTWLLVMNTVTSVVTFLMVFLIQRSQNKDALAVHVKLNEIVAAIEGASNHIVNVENLPEEELQRLREMYQEVADRLTKDKPSRAALSVPSPRGDNTST
jgi:low affinity Fe/Cu permease